MKALPESLRQFVARQTTRPVRELLEGDPEEWKSPYGSCWYRAADCLLLSGRIHPKTNGCPNMTETDRVCQEANFNQYLLERVGQFLAAAGILTVAWRTRTYEQGPHHNAFWNHDLKGLQQASRTAVARLAEQTTQDSRWLRIKNEEHLVELLTLFLDSFKDVGVREEQFGRLLLEFAQLPAADLIKAARALKLKLTEQDCARWSHWLNDRRQKAVLQALYTAEWAYFTPQGDGRTGWLAASPTALGMLGLAGPLPAPSLSKDLVVQSDKHVLAGAGLPVEKLVPLFRWCTIKRIAGVFEFELNPKRMAQSPAGMSPAEELEKVCEGLALPPTVKDTLKTESKLGGEVSIRGCSALIKGEKEVLEAIRAHPKLKGYIEAGAPPGYLLIKAQSNPNNFVFRCRQLGFVVKQMEGRG
jgi:hypothetical protein